jgi:hypothetical protein|tara:strand:+ start:1387 stop:1926 length:540 start_codon:yes stop_codon:yes gene_type:complete
MAITRLNTSSLTGVTIPNTSINNASLNSVTALPSGIDTGKVLQIQRANVSDTSLTSSSYTQIASVNITPVNSSSNMYLHFSFATGYTQSGGSDHKYSITFYRNDTNLCGGGFSACKVFTDRSGTLFGGFSAVKTDTTHGSSSQITYKIMARSLQGSSFHVGKDDAHQSGSNEFVVMEIL